MKDKKLYTKDKTNRVYDKSGELRIGKEFDIWFSKALSKQREEFKKIIESVPLENTGGTYYDFISEDRYREEGFNNCVSQIKQWKKKILEEL